MAHGLRLVRVMRLQIAFVGAALAVGCGGSDDESTGRHRYTVDVSRYSAPNDPPMLFIPNENLALPLEAKDLSLTEAAPGSLQAVYSRSYCEAGQKREESGVSASSIQISSLLSWPNSNLVSARMTPRGAA